VLSCVTVGSLLVSALGLIVTRSLRAPCGLRMSSERNVEPLNFPMRSLRGRPLPDSVASTLAPDPSAVIVTNENLFAGCAQLSTTSTRLPARGSVILRGSC